MESEFAAGSAPPPPPPGQQPDELRPEPFAWLGAWGGMLTQLDPHFEALGAWARPYCGGWYGEDSGVTDGTLGRFVIVFALWVGFTTLLFVLQRRAPPQQRTSASSDLFDDKDPKSDGPAPLEIAGGIAGRGRSRGGASAGAVSSGITLPGSASGLKRRAQRAAV